MLKKLWTGLLSSAALVTLAATVFFSFAAPSTSAAPTPRDTYSAGTQELGGGVCDCPILVGNCACRIKGVSPFEDAE